MSDQIKHTILRFAIIFLIMVVCFASVVAMIIYIQTSPTEEEKWQKIEASQEQVDIPVEPTRGNILDANGNLLASSLPQYIVRMDTRVDALKAGGDTLFYKYIDSIADGLSRIIGDKSPQEYKHLIVTTFRKKSDLYKDKDIRLYKGRITYVQKREIQQLPLIKRGIYKSGVYFENVHIRKKPFGRLGSRTIGTVLGEAGVGNSGLENSYESVLHGTPGLNKCKRVAGSRSYVPIIEAVDGDDVVTTLDVNLMDICEKALESKLKEYEAEWGCVILMEAHSGQVKALINLDRQSNGTYNESMNHAMMHVEPGSTFKTIAMMAALDDKKVQIDDTFHVFKNGWKYLNYSRPHTDSHPKDTFYTLRSALAVSSNIAFSRMVVKSYNGKAEPFVKKLESMGLTYNFPFDISGIPTSCEPVIKVPDDEFTISKMAYGYSVELTPLQILTFYNAIANNGKMIRPYMVSRIEHNGETIDEFGTEVLNASICSKKTLQDVRSALHDVVWDNALGTASVRKINATKFTPKAQSELVHIAGKTGTAQLYYQGAYRTNKHRITFVGYFPEEDPQYTCICMIEHPKFHPKYDAGMDCGTVVREIAERTMAYGWVYEYNNGKMILKRK